MLDGRVKTLHPKIHGGLLADLGNESHRRDLDLHGIRPFELVVSNLYPFEQRPDIETIDIGGPADDAPRPRTTSGSRSSPTRRSTGRSWRSSTPTTVRSARKPDARSRRSVRAHGRVRRRDRAVAAKPTSCCRNTSRSPRPHRRDAAVRREPAPARRALPQQRRRSWWDDVVQHGGLALSYLNYYDADAAWKLVHDLGDGPACAIIKHANPCGVARRRRARGRVPARSNATSVRVRRHRRRFNRSVDARPSSAWSRVRRPTS